MKSALDDNIGSLMQDIVNGANAELIKVLALPGVRSHHRLPSHHRPGHPLAALRGLHFASLCSFPFL